VPTNTSICTDNENNKQRHSIHLLYKNWNNNSDYLHEQAENEQILRRRGMQRRETATCRADRASFSYGYSVSSIVIGSSKYTTTNESWYRSRDRQTTWSEQQK